jgi:hypothetical protein
LLLLSNNHLEGVTQAWWKPQKPTLEIYIKLNDEASSKFVASALLLGTPFVKHYDNVSIL